MTDKGAYGHTEAEFCPKRNWVLSVLSDDEAVDAGSPLPQGLRFHLSRCAPCREVADRLQSVSAEIAALGEASMPGALVDRADAQALAALEDGTRLTGRVFIDDDEEFAAFERSGLAMPGRMLGLAAMILFAAGLFVLYRGDLSQRDVAPGGDETIVRGAWSDDAPIVDDWVEPPVMAEDPLDPAPPTAPRLADVNVGPAPKRSPVRYQTIRQPVICRHLTHTGAALCDRPHRVHRASVVMDPLGAGDGWRYRVDKNAPNGSTAPGSRER